ncbi:arginine-tRNA-protein transferase [Mycena filopes]|nr:arginine-tRNA-protein transferase [Mycena filopes]
MIDRGWRRSGTWCYKPDLKASCCPSYTIKLDADKFKPSKSQRKLINRWNRFILRGKETDLPSKSKEKTFSLSDAIHAAESRLLTHKKNTTCIVNIKEIFNDSKSTPSRFRSFLVHSPLISTPIPYPSPPPPHLPTNYGSYHQLYKCDGQLFAMGVIDILPSCVSSVYFMYDSAWGDYSIGKLSALREVSLAAEIRAAGVAGMAWLYMGYYIHSCPKMKYKGDYHPSYLADPETYVWFPLKECLPLLEQNRYACFSEPDHSTAEPSSSMQINEPPETSDDVLGKVLLVRGIENSTISVIPVDKSPHWSVEEIREDILGCIAGLGEALAQEVIFYVE